MGRVREVQSEIQRVAESESLGSRESGNRRAREPESRRVGESESRGVREPGSQRARKPEYVDPQGINMSLPREGDRKTDNLAADMRRQLCEGHG